MAMRRPLSLFLDESGEQIWPPAKSLRNPKSLWAYVGGILINPEEVQSVRHFNMQLVDFVSQRVGRKVTWIHTTDLMKCEKAYRGLSRQDADLCIQRTIEFIQSRKIRIVGARNNLANLEKRRGRRDVPYLCTLESALSQVDLLSRKGESTFQAILATGNQVSQKDILAFITKVQSETRIGSSGLPFEGRRLERLSDGVSFGEPRQTPCLQLADTVTWLLKRNEERYRARLANLWLMDPYGAHEPSSLLPPKLASGRRAEGRTYATD
ncbi:MAG: hypothetical protein QOE90_2844 [Thermoplasmata archaeon]|jgi:hypothetical protein|nr:hypothetical protein [Thermoplasmata archaeon]